MRINVKKTINDYDDKPMKIKVQEGTDANGNPILVDKNLLLGNMIINALNTPTDDDKNVSAEEKVQRAVISMDVHKALKDGSDGFVDIVPEDVGKIQKLLNNFYAPLALMRAYEVLDPKPEDVEKKAKK